MRLNVSETEKTPVNVSKVRQLSPFRYPGGKTWLVPEIRRWLNSFDKMPEIFVEPYAGGGIVSLTVAVENLAGRVIMNEIDPYVSAVWHTILQQPDYLCDRILNFKVNIENVRKILNSPAPSVAEKAFQAIIKNRTQRGGIMAPGASLIKSGENGRGLKSRWYPDTLVRRIETIYKHRDRIEFVEGDGFALIGKFKRRKKAAFFIDPPYTAGGKRAGRRLYSFNDIDHMGLFRCMAQVSGQFLMTYDDTKEVRYLAGLHKFQVEQIPMKNTHHDVVFELMITKAQ